MGRGGRWKVFTWRGWLLNLLADEEEGEEEEKEEKARKGQNLDFGFFQGSLGR